MGGSYALRDVAGRTVTSASLRGRWNLFYFGYSRCTDTCPVALPTIVEAARSLNAEGTAARAVFVDIEAPSGVITPRNPGVPATEHGHHGSSQNGTAISAISKQFGSALLVLTGSRSQLNAATVAFQVRREHTPPRPLEKGHSINHTSFIYLVSPTGQVVKYLYHDVAPQEIVRVVRGKELTR
jgi:cytochrome oxidase Cu insertion factor (SCO1/SenC/PrrC family)